MNLFVFLTLIVSAFCSGVSAGILIALHEMRKANDDEDA